MGFVQLPSSAIGVFVRMGPKKWMTWSFPEFDFWMAVGGIQRVRALTASDGSGQRRFISFHFWVCGTTEDLLLVVGIDAVALGNERFLDSICCLDTLVVVTIFVAVEPMSSLLLALDKSSTLESEDDEELDKSELEDDEESDEPKLELLLLEEEELTDNASSFPL